MKNSIIVITIAVLFLCSAVHATTWYVHPDSTLNSIQAGMDLCATGDTVLVGAGTYVENINFNGMAITVTSEYGPDTTIIDGGSPTNSDTGSVALFVNGEDTNSVLEGFTIANGSGTNDPVWGNLGGGILCMNSSPVIANNIIFSNIAEWGGGLECIFDAHAIARNNTFFNNQGTIQGGGISTEFSSSPLIINNTINGNAGGFGGGIVIDSLSQAIVRKNIITNNTAYNYGGGVGCYNNCSPTIDSCVITGNNLWGIHVGYSYPEIHECNIFDNAVYEVYNYPTGIVVNAENNWWGHATGPYHPTSNPGGQGGMVSNFVDFDPWATGPWPWGVEEYESTEPSFVDLQVNPNPFRDRVSIMFGTEYNMETTVFTIYDATGRVVKAFDHLTNNHIFWNGTDNAKRRLPSGVYFLKMETVSNVATKKLLMIR